MSPNGENARTMETPIDEQANGGMADAKDGVAAVYEDEGVADSYLAKRMTFSWQKLLHRRQVEILNRVIAAHRPDSVLELAPGPARLSTDVSGVSHGVMVENSDAMIRIALRRLRQRGLDDIWSVKAGSAFDLDHLLSGDQFALAYTFRFIRHFRQDERSQLYRELDARLAPGGMLVFDVVSKHVRDALDARAKEAPSGELNVYDATYTPELFRAEMDRNGFSVVELVPVLTHFGLQSWLSYKGDDVAPGLVGAIVSVLERIPFGTPLEWVAVCRKH